MTLNRRFVIALGFAALLGVTAAQAQERQFADVPFAFEVAGKHVAVGSYMTMRQTNGTLVVRNKESGEEVLLVPMLTGRTDIEKSRLTFKRYGSTYFLHKVQFGRQGTIYEVMTSKHEKELARGERPEVILVAMR